MSMSQMGASMELKNNGLARTILLGLVFLLGFAIRVYDLKDPPLDFHPTRQLRSALISRAVYYQLDPTVDPDTRSLAKQLASLEVYEPPILESVVGATYAVMHKENFWVSRIYNAFFWFVGGLALFLLGRKHLSFWAILTGLAFYFFLPFSVITSRSFQPDPWMVMWILLAGLAIVGWSSKQNWKWAVTAGLIGGIAVLVKSVAAFFVLGIYAAVILDKLGIKGVFKTLQPWAMAALALAPTAVYYLFFNQGRSSDFFSFWFVSLSGLLLETEFYADWLAMVKGLMGLTTFALGIVGAIVASRQLKPLLIGAWVGYGLYGLVFPYQFTTHEYYHIALVPIVALSIMPILDLILNQVKNQHWVWRTGLAGVIVFSSFYGLWVSRSILFASNYQTEPISWRRVGEAIPEDHSFIALTADYGMRLRYYGWRMMSASWPSNADLNLFSLAGNDPLEYESYFEEVTSGKDYFVVTAFSELDSQSQLKEILYDGYPIYSEGDGYLIFDLSNPLNP